MPFYVKSVQAVCDYDGDVDDFVEQKDESEFFGPFQSEDLAEDGRDRLFDMDDMYESETLWYEPPYENQYGQYQMHQLHIVTESEIPTGTTIQKP